MWIALMLLFPAYVIGYGRGRNSADKERHGE